MKDHVEPKPPEQNSQQITTKILMEHVTGITLPSWPVDELVQFSYYESSNQALAADKYQLLVSQQSNLASYRPAKFYMPDKKPRIEILDDKEGRFMICLSISYGLVCFLLLPLVANAVVHLVFGYTTLPVDLTFLIEGQTESELSERILGVVRFSELNTTSARQVELHSKKRMRYLQSSLPTRSWKSLDQGFSQLITPGGQESETNSHAAHVNGDADHKSKSDADKL
ncbi:unnamed protein product [Fraxinus pennsylvanica]|uniref:Protein ENHANCED DISEASE RESISTANCE 2 C-terminal domain-containing protein n=1 Tax=Fraxinus pennsylvanica TaxID=56036 RepID=A0AAD1Z5U8_9LAMI|nr:unnamed protein product [Fraxinus pennsylvanica]